MKRLILFALLIPTMLCAEVVGVISQASGDVQILRKDATYKVVKGVSVEAFDMIICAVGANAEVGFDDGSVISIAENSEIYLADYQLDSKKQVKKAEISLIKGWMRFFTAKLQPGRQYTISSQTMTAGIRGTEGIFYTSDDSSQLQLESGRVSVHKISHDRAEKKEKVVAGQRVEYNRKGKVNGFMSRWIIPKRMKRKLTAVSKKLFLQRRKAKFIRQLKNHEIDKILRKNPRLKKKLRRYIKQSLPRSRLKTRLRREPLKQIRLLRRN